MGRRSINTTKSGKYMNPTDQARKEARKKELKKNKKQRQMVRAAVLKGKDPAQLIEEMEKIDEMEYNVYQPSPLNEKVLREKRKKLKETFDRVMRLYHNDDPELWAELKRKEVEYEKRRNKKVQYYESVKHAQTVQVDEIPLPQMNVSDTATPPNLFNIPGRIPLPSALPVTGPAFPTAPAHGILKKPPPVVVEPVPEKKTESKKKEPPGCPPGPPPNLIDLPELDSDFEEDEPVKTKRPKSIRFLDDAKAMGNVDQEVKLLVPAADVDKIKPTSLQQRMLAISGQNIDEFMKEMENVHKKKEQERAADLHERLSTLEKDNPSVASDASDSENDSTDEEATINDASDTESDSEDDDNEEIPVPKNVQMMTAPVVAAAVVAAATVPTPPAIKLPSGPPPPPVGMPPAMLFRPPPLRPNLGGMAIRMPPGPPPGRPGVPPGPPPGMPPRLGIRMPPGPPPGMPPNRMHHGPQSHHKQQQQQLMHGGPPGGNILSAAPQLTKDTKGMTTITAKPQIRNLSADVTRFLPSTLRTKRHDDKVKQPPSHHMMHSMHQHHQHHAMLQKPGQRQFPVEHLAGKHPTHAEPTKPATKDDAYMQFMREMQGLL